MAKRRKRLRKRVRTWKELCRLRKSQRDNLFHLSRDVLFTHHDLKYENTRGHRVLFGSAHRMLEGRTLYTVYPHAARLLDRDKYTPDDRRAVTRRMRQHTPWRPGDPPTFVEKTSNLTKVPVCRYVVEADGAWRLLPPGSTTPPFWVHLPPKEYPPVSVWFGTHRAPYPRFYARTRSFVRQLEAMLADYPETFVALEQRDCISIHTTPTPSGWAWMQVVPMIHNAETRRRFGKGPHWGKTRNAYRIDVAHQDNRYVPTRLFANGQDALRHIAEWVLSSVYIPGPG